jgi:hypothetical protein
MADARKPILDRMTALVAGPFLLGRRALDLTFLKEEAPSGPPPPPAPPRISITPPDHAIKRRG